MEDWKNTKCGNCVIQRQKPICNSCIGHHYYRPMTNAQKIRSMTDEELAEFLIRQHACDCCDYYGCGARCKAPDGFVCTNGYASAIIQKWLQSEAE